MVNKGSSFADFVRLSKLEKKSSIRIWAASVFVLKYVHIYVIFANKHLKKISLIDDLVLKMGQT